MKLFFFFFGLPCLIVKGIFPPEVIQFKIPVVHFCCGGYLNVWSLKINNAKSL